MRYHLTTVRKAITKKTTNNKCKDFEKWELSYAGGENVNCYSHYGKHYGDSSKNIKIEPQYNPYIFLLVYENIKTKTLV